ncbi:hypothetical protein [Streptomyces sp. Tue6028]|uniref:hypothetical protein n=1 Tax=Streptomyces sp. Tue6028 TaxID=2036037 RepID=UPI003D75C9DE
MSEVAVAQALEGAPDIATAIRLHAVAERTMLSGPDRCELTSALQRMRKAGRSP